MPENYLADAPLAKALDTANATLDTWQAAKDAPPSWQPPVIYDVAIDRHRLATQADIDSIMKNLNRLSQLYSGILRAFRDAGGEARL